MKDILKSGTLIKVYASIARLALYVAVLFIPLAYFPWTVDALEVNKQTILLIVISVGTIAWLGTMVARRQFAFKKTWLFIVPVLLVISVAISSFTSPSVLTSWVGQGLQEYTSFLSFLAFSLLFIVASHLLSETKTQQTVWFLFLLASSLIGLNVSFAIFGLQILPTNFIGTPNSLGFFMTSVAVLASGLWLVDGNKVDQQILPAGIMGIVSKVLIFITVVADILILLSIDYWMLWLSAILGMGIIFGFAILRADEFPNTSKFVLPMLLFVVSLLFLFLPSPLGGRFSPEVSPSYGATLNIAKATLAEHSVLFGSGPGTFSFNYAKYVVQDVNNTQLWDVRFDRGGSYLLTLLSTIGVVGTLLMFSFIMWLLVLGLKMLITERAHAEWKTTFVAFSAWLVLAFGLFAYSANFTLLFVFWLLSAVLVSQSKSQVYASDFKTSPRFGLLTAFLFVLVNVGLLTVIFVSSSRYISEIAFAHAVEKDKAGATLDDVIIDLDRAARLNKLSDANYRNLANALLLKAGELIKNPDTTPEQLQSFIGASKSAAERAKDLSPQNVTNWAMLGDIYREVSPVVEGADQYAVGAYLQAVELSPTNPKYRTVLGRAYLVRADQLGILAEGDDEEIAKTASENQTEAIRLAVESLLKAVELKPNYAPAVYNLALAYERQGNLAEAVTKMEALRAGNPSDIGISLQLGLLYLKQGKTELAQTELERSIEIAPNYSNARWFLSAVYEQQGNYTGAIEQVEKVLELNPDNSAVQQRLDRLKTGDVNPKLPEPLEETSNTASDSIVTTGDSTVSELPVTP
ncbi:hypothetical protein COY25_04565 [Candidatus Uhrbacteria bacterium CG_4_10_14_0_2_um_filter_41_7]|uniref:Uncharacterized protein n=1 Tax=Candidatus Uhrbacteria bacterium CG_4_9_14_3_um_filter_41_35 TaxID=1975034 RepID=A0A2M7XGP5_9BACT|nr:MAG: hypothetical protein COY25_04565 [Candidatus Uhrbacteria bacterium CG_4_10_14_0_2_um_filter_41_7]PJA47025.1 MAG: hypothetical protein CO173_00420 [Candidatus Uhrbacteria bacterium CG_4_9_14_3_um_filter_41_35]